MELVEVRSQLHGFLVDNMGLDMESLSDSDTLFSSQVLDSFSLVDIIMFIESQYGIKVNPGDVNLDNFDSIQQILDYISQNSE